MRLENDQLQYMITQLEVRLARRLGGGQEKGPLPRLMTIEQRKALHLDDVDNYQKHIYFWQNVPRRAKYTEVWNEVKASQ